MFEGLKKRNKDIMDHFYNMETNKLIILLFFAGLILLGGNH